MKARDVPQDDDAMFAGRHRACYAVDDNGRYTVVASKGWEVETIVNGLANAELRAALEQLRQRVLRGEASALEFHMQRCQMTPAMLAANSGIWTWRVRRHLRPKIFAHLKPALLARYADALRVTRDELQQVPSESVA
jgi:hypothetical protein